ncbi:hypothetical protein CRN76_14520 [Chryseobacterium indologenes]|uniref:hypothetical protein n=2 Tax=Chryseobacterium indologenes TaxID=253 RepID=UPI000BFB8B03|nr:hypothetical protein [Chryseobacterium indologenes]ATN06533.1 hypothetical protein CRN76_14520 [Chryseobacterium indologenes]AYY84706.1 hypothetical protein EGX91_09205 [Chryseobacterium indologenes]QIX81590.1 hypothetical protein FOB56_10255 [Chryseobacterium indologenes]
MDVKMIISLFFCFLLLGCNTSENNQIKVSIKVVDSYTHEPRVNDRVKVLIGKWGFPTRQYEQIGEYYTDSSGVVKLNLSKDERYSFMTFGANHAFGSDEYKKGELKNNQRVVIEVVPPDKKQFKIEE